MREDYYRKTFEFQKLLVCFSLIALAIPLK